MKTLRGGGGGLQKFLKHPGGSEKFIELGGGLRKLVHFKTNIWHHHTDRMIFNSTV